MFAYLKGKLMGTVPLSLRGGIVTNILELCKKIRSWLSYIFIFILYAVVSLFVTLIELRLSGLSTSSKKLVKKPRMLPTAEELREAGVVFIKKENTRSYMDVSFDKANGTMEIPLVHIQENSNSEFRNFLALEQCCPDVGNNFTSYVVFMDNLIDGWKDVSLLRRSGIIESKLGCDQDVATIKVKVKAPPPMNAMEQLIALKTGISQLEQFIQDANIFLLKSRALLLSILPQATDKVSLVLVLFTSSIVFLPVKVLLLCVFLEMSTRYSPPRKSSTERLKRRLKEWWFSIPAAPVLLERSEEDKNK